jgi:transposase-like protein
VRLAQTSGKPIAQIVRELGISDSSIHQWRKWFCQNSEKGLSWHVASPTPRAIPPGLARVIILAAIQAPPEVIKKPTEIATTNSTLLVSRRKAAPKNAATRTGQTASTGDLKKAFNYWTEYVHTRHVSPAQEEELE